MPKQIFVNLPIKDLSKSTSFYDALGFTKNPDFSNESASCMVWSDEIYVMLLTHEFYKSFLRGKEISDSAATSGALFAITCDSKEEVQSFADTAKQNGGDFFAVDSGVPADMMFGYEVLDPDGHTWEPLWMNPEFNPKTQ